MNKRYSITLLLVAFCFFAFSQHAILKGFTYDESTGESLPYCTVQLMGTNYGALSDVTGAFLINKIPAGTYTVKVSRLGYVDLFDTVAVGSNGTITKRYSVSPNSQTLDAVQIVGENTRKEQETRTSVISVTPKDMSKMPAIGGQPDFAQYLQVLPGIISTGDQGGQLYVRGGTPVQNMLLLDGTILYNPFHSIGIFSVFDMDIMSSADVYTGGFGAEFGGRLSSVMDIKTRDGNKKRLAGKVDLSNIGAQLLLEGPLLKLKDDRKTSISFILSGKGSFLEQSSKVFYPYVQNSEGLPYTFLDLYGKLTLATRNGSRWNIFGFNYDDRVNYSSIAKYGWNNWGVGTNFLIVPGDAPTTIEGSLSYSKYESELEDAGFDPRKSSMDGFTFDFGFNYYLGKSFLKVGIDVVGYNTNYEYYTIYHSQRNIVDHTTDMSIFIKYKYNFRNKLLIEPGFRLQYYYSLGEVSPEPRLAIKYNILNNLRLKLAAGMYSQNLVSVTSDQDVVSLFNGFLSSPLESALLPETLIGSDVEFKGRLQKSQHVILGLEYDPISSLSINLEGYYKNFSQLISVNRYKMSDEDSEFIWEKGNAYGGDISVKYEQKGVYLWFVYSLGWVNRNDGKIEYNPHFDRRHNINLVASYSFGKRRSWEVNCRWNFGSGFPFTQTQAYYPHYYPSHINDDYVSNNEDVYNYKNIFYVNRTTNNIVYQLPFLYYFGLTWRF